MTRWSAIATDARDSSRMEFEAACTVLQLSRSEGAVSQRRGSHSKAVTRRSTRRTANHATQRAAMPIVCSSSAPRDSRFWHVACRGNSVPCSGLLPLLCSV